MRCTTLALQSLWLDEVYTVVEAGRPWPDLLLALFDPRQAYPLYILGIRLWTALFGTGELALRWPSAIASVATVPLLWLLGRRLFGWTTGLLAAALLALSPLAVWYAQEAKTYAIAMLLIVVAWLLLWEAVERRSRAAWGALGAVALVVLFTHRLLAVLAVIGLLFYILYAARQGSLSRRYRYLLVGVLLAAIVLTVAGLWYVLGQEGAARQFGGQRDWRDPARAFTQFSLHIPVGLPEPGRGPDRRPWLAAFAAAAIAGTVALVQDVRAHGRRRRRAVFLFSCLAVPVGTFALLYLISPLYWERYLLGILPAYLLLLAVGITALWRWAAGLHRKAMGKPEAGGHQARPYGRAGLAQGFAAVLSFLLGAIALVTFLGPLAVSWQQVQNWTLSSLPSKEQYGQATLYLQQHLHPGDLVVIHPGYILPAVEYYQARFPRVPLYPHQFRDFLTTEYGFREFEADMEDLSRGRRRAWLLIAPFHAPFLDPQNWVWEWFNLNPFLHCDEQHYNGVDLYCVTFNEERRLGMSSPQIALDLAFGQEILLWGANLEPFQRPLQAGDTLPLTLYTRGLRAGLPDLEAAVRLVGVDGRVWAEEARQPLGGFLPTSSWLPTDSFLDYHELLLPPEMPAGRYSIEVGYRQAADPAAMLPLPSGSPWATLDTVEVTAKGGSP